MQTSASNLSVWQTGCDLKASLSKDMRYPLVEQIAYNKMQS